MKKFRNNNIPLYRAITSAIAVIDQSTLTIHEDLANKECRIHCTVLFKIEKESIQFVKFSSNVRKFDMRNHNICKLIANFIFKHYQEVDLITVTIQNSKQEIKL